jgi:hypothetical protein
MSLMSFHTSCEGLHLPLPSLAIIQHWRMQCLAFESSVDV